jgi:hypothetical protein
MPFLRTQVALENSPMDKQTAQQPAYSRRLGTGFGFFEKPVAGVAEAER